MIACDTFRDVGSGIAACPRPAKIQVRAGCVHEHIVDGWVCEGCIEDLANGRLECGRCDAGPEAHVCEIVGKPVGTRD